MANQGKLLSEADISKIVDLLATTDMSMSDIAVRMGCSRSAVATINRKSRVRYYNGRRSVWATKESGSKVVAMSSPEVEVKPRVEPVSHAALRK